MEKIKIGNSEDLYEIVSIQPVDTGVLQIMFADAVPPDWGGDITLYTSGEVEATVLAGYDTLLIQEDKLVQLAQSDSGSEPVVPPEPQKPLYMQLMAQMAAMEQEQAVYGQAAMFAAATFTDEQALQVPELYDSWSGDSVPYKAGVRLNYNSILYKVLQDHTSQPDWTPDAAPSLFAKVLVADPEVIPEWEQPDSTNGYAKGDRVTHKGEIWESLVDNNVWEPGVVGTESVWKKKN